MVYDLSCEQVLNVSLLLVSDDAEPQVQEQHEFSGGGVAFELLMYARDRFLVLQEGVALLLDFSLLLLPLP